MLLLLLRLRVLAGRCAVRRPGACVRADVASGHFVEFCQ